MTLPPTSSDRSDSGLRDPAKKEIAMQLVSAAENSTLCWKEQYKYIEYNVENDDKENRGYTGGIVGFTSKTGDMLQVVERFDKLAPGNPLKEYIEALSKVNGTSSQEGLGEEFKDAWRSVDNDPKYRKLFRAAQDQVCDVKYFGPAVDRAQRDGLQTLGQFIYYDALVMHGEGKAPNEFDGIRTAATKKQRTPADGGDETEYLPPSSTPAETPCSRKKTTKTT